MTYKIIICIQSDAQQKIKVGELAIADKLTLNHFENIKKSNIPFWIDFVPVNIEIVQHGYAKIDDSALIEVSHDGSELIFTITDTLKIILITEEEFRAGTNRLSILN